MYSVDEDDRGNQDTLPSEKDKDKAAGFTSTTTATAAAAGDSWLMINDEDIQNHPRHHHQDNLVTLYELIMSALNPECMQGNISLFKRNRREKRQMYLTIRHQIFI